LWLVGKLVHFAIRINQMMVMLGILFLMASHRVSLLIKFMIMLITMMSSASKLSLLLHLHPDKVNILLVHIGFLFIFFVFIFDNMSNSQIGFSHILVTRMHLLLVNRQFTPLSK